MRAGYTMQIRPGKAAEYIESHRSVWPELIAAASQAGIRNHTVFLHGDTIFLYLEADDVDAALTRLKTEDVKQKWDAWMQEYLYPEVTSFAEVFHMD